MGKQCLITTTDNPFDPFDQFDSWNQFDTEKGYYSCSRVARLLNITEDMSEIEIGNEYERAIDRLVQLDPTNLYAKVTKTLTDE